MNNTRYFLVIVLASLFVGQAPAEAKPYERDKRKPKTEQKSDLQPRFVTPVATQTPQMAPASELAPQAQIVRIVVDVPKGFEYGRIFMDSQSSSIQWTSDSSQLPQERISELETVLANARYRLPSRQESVFEKSKTADTEFAIGGTVREIRSEVLIKSSFWTGEKQLRYTATSVKVDWEIFSTLHRKVVTRVTTQGYSYVRDEADVSKSVGKGLDESLKNSLRNLLAQTQMKSEFTQTTPPAVQESHAPIVVKQTSTSSAKIVDHMEDVSSSVVTILSGMGHGSGFIISESGYILTNYHVVHDAQNVKVRLRDGREFVGAVIRADQHRDTALIEIHTSGLHALPLHRELPTIGSKVYAIGSPLDPTELECTVSRGIISGHRLRDGLPYLQSDTNILPGNSGGPLLDRFGNVVGMTVSALLKDGSVPMGINFFIPIEEALSSLKIEIEE